MKKQLLSLFSLTAITLVVNAQNPTGHTESYDKGAAVTPCFLGYEGGPGAFQGFTGHDFTAMTWSESEGALKIKATTHASQHGPLYYQLSGGDAVDCKPAEGLVDLSKTPEFKIRAKATKDCKVYVYIQEGNAASWDYKLFSNSFVEMDLTSEYKEFTLNGGVIDSSLDKSGKVDITKIGVIAFELGKVGGSYPALSNDTITVDYIKFGDDVNSVSEVAAVQFSVYPNPASDVVNVNLASASAATVELADLAGKVVSTQVVNGTNSVAVNTSGLPAGLYVVTVKTANGSSSQKVTVK